MSRRYSSAFRVLGRQALAAVGAAAGEHFAAVSGGKAGAKSVAALSDEFTWLIGALHGTIP